MLFEEEITTLIIRVSNCSNDPLCPIKTPEINASVKIFEYVNEPEPNDAFLLQTGKTDISGTYQTAELEGNNYYFIRVETTDSTIQELLMRLDATTTKEEEFLFP